MTDGSPVANRVPEYVLRPADGFIGRLNPTTRLVVALAAAGVAFGVRGWIGPIVVLVAVLATAFAAGLGRRLRPYLLASIPIVASIMLINTFLYPGASDAFLTLGPFIGTWTGLTAALQATLRVEAFLFAVGVLALTTPIDDLLDDLERRGLGRRAVFVIGSAIRTVPRMIERAGEIVDAQRARGLDTEGSPWRRVRGVVPLAGPMVLSALFEVEERTMALEARGFSAPGRRATLRPVPDSVSQRVARWAAGVGAVALVGLTIAGVISIP